MEDCTSETSASCLDDSTTASMHHSVTYGMLMGRRLDLLTLRRGSLVLLLLPPFVVVVTGVSCLPLYWRGFREEA